MTDEERFIKTNLALLAIPGLHPRLRELYGRLVLYAGKNGKCHPRHSTLSKEFGVSRRQVINLLNKLHALGLIEWTRGQRGNTYRVLNPDVKRISHQMCNGVHISDVKRISHLFPYRKESSAKESVKRGPSPPTPSSKSSRQPDKPTSQAAGSAEAEGSTSNADDDAGVRTLTPEEQFRRRLVKRHGAAVDAEACIHTVKSELEKCHGLAFGDFVAYDQARTTGRTFTNPNGYYRHLARELAKQTRQQVRASAYEPLRRATAAAAAAESPGRCAKCNGPGVLADGEFCDCLMGRDLARVSRRAPPKTEKPQRAKGAA